MCFKKSINYRNVVTEKIRSCVMYRSKIILKLKASLQTNFKNNLEKIYIMTLLVKRKLKGYDNVNRKNLKDKQSSYLFFFYQEYITDIGHRNTL